MDGILEYIEDAFSSLDNAWDSKSINRNGSILPPEDIFLGDKNLLRNDINLQWLTWFCESICFLHDDLSTKNLHDVHSLVRRGLRNIGINTDSSDGFSLSKIIALFVSKKLDIIYERKRETATKDRKLELLESAGRFPKCWICNENFSDGAIELFLSSGRSGSIVLPSMIDYMMPRGLIERDLKIEIEHKIPFSKGGGDLKDNDNIALSCGWCNRHKSNFISLYDVGRSGKYYKHRTLGDVSIPEPYWIIRKMALYRECADKLCTRGRKNKLFVDLVNPHGTANPFNIKIVCCDHVKDYQHRLVPAKSYKEFISRSKNSNIML